MAKSDKQSFTCRSTKEGRVFIYYHGRQVVVLKGKRAEHFLSRIDSLPVDRQQLEMARVTGNFKRGNEAPRVNSGFPARKPTQ